jgi:predicted DNA-binding protein (UPF0251 family)
MGRPVKWRRIDQMPSVLQFLPAQQKGASAGENILLIEEYEAIRLKDLEGLEQEACADQMQVSRPTFQRILISARQKVADSLIHGKGIRIAGGNYTRNICPVLCLDCGQRWDESLEILTARQADYTCPHCQSSRIVCASSFEGHRQGPGARNRGCQRGCWRGNWSKALQEPESECEPDADHHNPD